MIEIKLTFDFHVQTGWWWGWGRDVYVFKCAVMNGCFCVLCKIRGRGEGREKIIDKWSRHKLRWSNQHSANLKGCKQCLPSEYILLMRKVNTFTTWQAIIYCHFTLHCNGLTLCCGNIKIQIISSEINVKPMCLVNLISEVYSVNWQPCYHLTFYYEKHTVSGPAEHISPTGAVGSSTLANVTIYHLSVVISGPGTQIWTYLVQLMDILKLSSHL